MQTAPEKRYVSSGSDVANLSIMSYKPENYHTGCSPLEALSGLGVKMEKYRYNKAIRLNLVTL